jgi:hypothetical protein
VTDQEIAQTLRKHAKAVDVRADGDNLDDPLHAAFDGLLELADQLDIRRLPVAVYSTPPEPGAVQQVRKDAEELLAWPIAEQRTDWDRYRIGLRRSVRDLLAALSSSVPSGGAGRTTDKEPLRAGEGVPNSTDPATASDGGGDSGAVQQVIAEMRDCAAAWMADNQGQSRAIGKCLDSWCDRLAALSVPSGGAGRTTEEEPGTRVDATGDPSDSPTARGKGR